MLSASSCPCVSPPGAAAAALACSARYARAFRSPTVKEERRREMSLRASFGGSDPNVDSALADEAAEVEAAEVEVSEVSVASG